MAGDSAAGDGVSRTPASSAENMEDCTLGATEGVNYEATLDPGMQSVHHAWSMAANIVAAGDEACVESPLGPSVQRVTTLEEDVTDNSRD